MAFTIGDIIVDRIQVGVAESFDGDLLYTLTQLSEATIETTADSVDATDAQGTLIKRFYRGKQGTFTATNAMLNLNIVGANSGSGVELATTENAIVMPKIVTVKASAKTVDITGFVDGTVKVHGMATNGSLGKEYTKASAASTTAFAIAGNVLTLPTGTDEAQFIIKYKRTVTQNGAAMRNKADKFPQTIKLTLKVLAVDPCSADTLRSAIIELPSFQPSPEVSISLSTDGHMDYSGDLQTNYCSVDKELYSFYWAEEDVEEE